MKMGKWMVHALFPPLPFCIKLTIWRRWNNSSFYLCLCITFFSIIICTYSLSSGRRLSMINHCFVWRCIASFHLPSFFLPCWIFCILANSMENRLGISYTTELINCHRYRNGFDAVCRSTVNLAFLRLQTKITRKQKIQQGMNNEGKRK